MDSACPLFKFRVIEILFISLTAKNKPIIFITWLFAYSIVINFVARFCTIGHFKLVTTSIHFFIAASKLTFQIALHVGDKQFLSKNIRCFAGKWRIIKDHILKIAINIGVLSVGFYSSVTALCRIIYCGCLFKWPWQFNAKVLLSNGMGWNIVIVPISKTDSCAHKQCQQKDKHLFAYRHILSHCPHIAVKTIVKAIVKAIIETIAIPRLCRIYPCHFNNSCATILTANAVRQNIAPAYCTSHKDTPYKNLLLLYYYKRGQVLVYPTRF